MTGWLPEPNPRSAPAVTVAAPQAGPSFGNVYRPQSNLAPFALIWLTTVEMRLRQPV